MKNLSLIELLLVQIRVVLSLVLRETHATYGKSAIGYLWAIFTPLMSITILVVIYSFAGRQAPFGISLALFFATGVLTLQFFNELSAKLSNIFQANKALMNYPLIKGLDTIWGRSILLFLTNFMVMLIFYLALFMLGLMALPIQANKLICAFLATFLLGLSFGILSAILTTLWKNWSNIEKIIRRPLFFISGIFYVPSQLPTEAINILKWNPVLHLIEWFRSGFYLNYNSQILNIYYPIIVGLILLAIGLIAERLTRKKRV